MPVSSSSRQWKLVQRFDMFQVTCRRKALKSFTFSNGLTVGAGNWVCIPLQAMMRILVVTSIPTHLTDFGLSSSKTDPASSPKSKSQAG